MAVELLREELELRLLKGEVERIQARSDCSIISVVGQGLPGHPSIASTALQAFVKNGIEVPLLVQGASSINISFVVAEEKLEQGIQLFHKELEMGISGE